MSKDQSIEGLALPIGTPIAEYRGISSIWRSLGESNPCFNLERGGGKGFYGKIGNEINSPIVPREPTDFQRLLGPERP
jgi:hypothetical protein